MGALQQAIGERNKDLDENIAMMERENLKMKAALENIQKFKQYPSL